MDKRPVYRNGANGDIKRVIDQITLSARRVKGGFATPGLSILFKDQVAICSTEEFEGEPERIVIKVGEFEICADNETFDFFSCDEEGSRGILIVSEDEKSSIWLDEEVPA